MDKRFVTFLVLTFFVLSLNMMLMRGRNRRRRQTGASRGGREKR